MTKSIPATYVARLLYDGKMINNLQVPIGQDPFGFAQGRLYGLMANVRCKPFAKQNPLIVMRGLNGSVVPTEAKHNDNDLIRQLPLLGC
ncbi:MAG: hypothetical protein K8R02_03650 [Anaerohalosphaeraceae bacterium]|nr:hypothetical protein [Anaerohalosphaeraceae bacterium]